MKRTPGVTSFRLRRPGIFRPRMLRISRAQLFTHFGVGPCPEAAEIGGHLHRPTAGREELERHRHTTDAYSRRLGQSEERLQLDRGDDHALVPVVEANGTS